MPDDLVSMWTVTHHPTDLPGVEYAARRWAIGRGRASPTDQLLTAPTLEELRAKLPWGLFNLGRDPSDDPAIVETWI